MRAINLDTYSLSLLTAKEDILNPRSSTNWALFAYDGVTTRLKLADSGVGGVSELAGKLHPGRPFYGLCRVHTDGAAQYHVVMIIWVGEKVDEYRRAECATHVPAVKAFFKEVNNFLSARTLEEVTEEKLRMSVYKAGEVKQRPRLTYRQENKEVVGTNYRRTIPAAEILKLQRESFWAREEREEEERKAEERRREMEDRRRRERERVLQERKEAEERERKMKEKEQRIKDQRRIQAQIEAEKQRQERLKWEKQLREHEQEMRARLTRSVSEIKAAQEAASLVSQRSMNPREFFRQLSSTNSQPNPCPGSPRTATSPFRRYHSSLTDSAFIFNKSASSTPTSPCSPTVMTFFPAPPSPYHPEETCIPPNSQTEISPQSSAVISPNNQSSTDMQPLPSLSPQPDPPCPSLSKSPVSAQPQTPSPTLSMNFQEQTLPTAISYTPTCPSPLPESLVSSPPGTQPSDQTQFPSNSISQIVPPALDETQDQIQPDSQIQPYTYFPAELNPHPLVTTSSFPLYESIHPFSPAESTSPPLVLSSPTAPLPPSRPLPALPVTSQKLSDLEPEKDFTVQASIILTVQEEAEEEEEECEEKEEVQGGRSDEEQKFEDGEEHATEEKAEEEEWEGRSMVSVGCEGKETDEERNEQQIKEEGDGSFETQEQTRKVGREKEIEKMLETLEDLIHRDKLATDLKKNSETEAVETENKAVNEVSIREENEETNQEEEETGDEERKEAEEKDDAIEEIEDFTETIVEDECPPSSLSPSTNLDLPAPDSFLCESAATALTILHPEKSADPQSTYEKSFSVTVNNIPESPLCSQVQEESLMSAMSCSNLNPGPQANLLVMDVESEANEPTQKIDSGEVLQYEVQPVTEIKQSLPIMSVTPEDGGDINAALTCVTSPSEVLETKAHNENDHFSITPTQPRPEVNHETKLKCSQTETLEHAEEGGNLDVEKRENREEECKEEKNAEEEVDKGEELEWVNAEPKTFLTNKHSPRVDQAEDGEEPLVVNQLFRDTDEMTNTYMKQCTQEYTFHQTDQTDNVEQGQESEPLETSEMVYCEKKVEPEYESTSDFNYAEEAVEVDLLATNEISDDVKTDSETTLEASAEMDAVEKGVDSAMDQANENSDEEGREINEKMTELTLNTVRGDVEEDLSLGDPEDKDSLVHREQVLRQDDDCKTSIVINDRKTKALPHLQCE